MIITGCNEETEKDLECRSYSDNSDLNRTFVSMRNNLRDDLKEIKNIQW
jgi:hypothetical protein